MSHLVLYGQPIKLNKIQNFVKYGQVGSLLKANSMVSLKYSSSNKAPFASNFIFFGQISLVFGKIFMNFLNYCFVPFAFKANFACEIQICYDMAEIAPNLVKTGFFQKISKKYGWAA